MMFMVKPRSIRHEGLSSSMSLTEVKEQDSLRVERILMVLLGLLDS
jgi:hypothetical protein